MTQQSTDKIRAAFEQAVDSIEGLFAAAQGLPTPDRLQTIRTAGLMASNLLELTVVFPGAGSEHAPASEVTDGQAYAGVASGNTLQHNGATAVLPDARAVITGSQASSETAEIQAGVGIGALALRQASLEVSPAQEAEADAPSVEVTEPMVAVADVTPEPISELAATAPVPVGMDDKPEEATEPTLGVRLVDLRSKSRKLFLSTKANVVALLDYLDSQDRPVKWDDIKSSGIFLKPGQDLDDTGLKGAWDSARGAMKAQDLWRFVVQKGERGAAEYSLNRQAVAEALETPSSRKAPVAAPPAEAIVRIAGASTTAQEAVAEVEQEAEVDEIVPTPEHAPDEATPDMVQTSAQTELPTGAHIPEKNEARTALDVFKQSVDVDKLPTGFVAMTQYGIGYAVDEKGKKIFYLRETPHFLAGVALRIFEYLLATPTGESEFTNLKKAIETELGHEISVKNFGTAISDLEKRFANNHDGFFSELRQMDKIHFRYIGVRGVLSDEQREELQHFLAPEQPYGAAPHITKDLDRAAGSGTAEQTAPTIQPQTRIQISQAELKMREHVYGEKGAILVGFMEANVGREVTEDDLLRLFPDDKVESSLQLLQTTLDVMASTPEYIGRVASRGQRGYKRMLLPEQERTQTIEEVLTTTAYALYSLVRVNADGIQLGAAINFIERNRGRKIPFQQFLDGIEQIKQYFGDRFVAVPNGHPGTMVLRLRPEEELVYSRKRPVK